MKDWKYTPKSEREREAALPEQENQIPEETPEGFASRNVKTITFMICMIVLLATIGPLSVFHIYRYVQENKEPEGKVMTEAEVIRLSKLGPALTMEELEQYRGEASESEYRRFYYIYFDNYILLAIEDVGTGVMDFCTLTDETTKDSIDIRKDDVQAFLETH